MIGQGGGRGRRGRQGLVHDPVHGFQQRKTFGLGRVVAAEADEDRPNGT